MTLSVYEKLLLAAADLDQDGDSFTAEDLVVAAWRKYPDTFGLSGHEDEQGKPLYPNSNRVFVEVMGSKPIRKQGLLVKAGTKRFEPTEAGRQRAAVLGGRPEGSGRKATFGREAQRDLKKILGTRAVAKYQSGREAEITFHDAAAFWGISARSSAMEAEGRMRHVQAVLETAHRAAKDQPLTLQHGASSHTQADVQQLLGLEQTLRERFEDDLAIIRGRTDERSRTTS